MKIAFDLNDVVRDFSDNLIKTYLTEYNREFDTSDFEIWTNDYQALLPFPNERAYHIFMYRDFVYELYGKCGTCYKNLSTDMNGWITNLQNIEDDETIEVMFVSPMEYGHSVNYTYFFISKLGCDVREVYLPKDSMTIWDKCDVLVTANPKLIEGKPEGKKVIKINREYNKECVSEYSYNSLKDFFNDNTNCKF